MMSPRQNLPLFEKAGLERRGLSGRFKDISFLFPNKIALSVIIGAGARKMKKFLIFLLFSLSCSIVAGPCDQEIGPEGLCSDKKRPTGVSVKTCLQVNETNLSQQCRDFIAPRPEGSNLLFYTAIILIGITVFIITRIIFADEDSYKAAEQIGESDEKSSKLDYSKYGIILRYSRPFFKRYITPIVESMKNKKKIKKKYKRELASAGLTDFLTPEDFFSFKLFLIIGFPIVFMVVRFFLEETWPLTYIPLIAIFGHFYPDIWIKGKIKQRKKEIIMFMPFAVDMMALSVEAGLDFIAAMTKVIDKAKPSALNDEFKILIKEIKIGASRAEALRNMAWRVNLIQVSSFCATLIAADSVGASIGPILKGLSGEIRRKRSSDAEKAGATAATKILFPMLFLIVPAVMIMIFAPLGIQFLVESQ